MTTIARRSAEIGTSEDRLAFWSLVYATHPPALAGDAPPTRLTYDFRPAFAPGLHAYAGFSATELTHSLRIYPADQVPALHARLAPLLPELEARLGTQAHDLGRIPHLLIRTRRFDFADRAAWPDAIAWIAGCDATLIAALDALPEPLA